MINWRGWKEVWGEPNLRQSEKLVCDFAGVLLKKIVGDWKSVRDNTIEPKDRKAFLYAGHDSTIANLLSALKVFDPQVPGYGAAILLELSRDKITKQYGVEVLYCFDSFYLEILYILLISQKHFRLQKLWRCKVYVHHQFAQQIETWEKEKMCVTIFWKTSQVFKLQVKL